MTRQVGPTLGSGMEAELPVASPTILSVSFYPSQKINLPHFSNVPLHDTGLSFQQLPGSIHLQYSISRDIESSELTDFGKPTC
jgi:hypothetical protein